MNNLPPTSAEEEAKAAVLAEHDFRRDVDRAAGLHNDLHTSASRWREFLEANHAAIAEQWPAIHDAVVDARRWENPIHFNGSFAEKVARAKALPAISTVGQFERIICRALIMMNLPQPERERLIKQAFDAEREAHRISSLAKTRKLGAEDLDVSEINFNL